MSCADESWFSFGRSERDCGQAHVLKDSRAGVRSIRVVRDDQST
jgi:hypothetical protein